MTTATFLHRGSTPFTSSRSAASVPDYNSVYFGNSQAIQRLSGEYIGYMTLTLTNVVVGSSIRIELAGSGTLVEFRTATLTSEVFTVPYYAPADPGNDLRIKVRKGTSATKYQPFETLATAGEAAQSVYIAQVADPIA
jgi:hypothetical protein